MLNDIQHALLKERIVELQRLACSGLAIGDKRIQVSFLDSRFQITVRLNLLVKHLLYPENADIACRVQEGDGLVIRVAVIRIDVDIEILAGNLAHDFDDFDVPLQTFVAIHEETTAPNFHLARPKAVPYAAFRIFRYPFQPCLFRVVQEIVEVDGAVVNRQPIRIALVADELIHRYPEYLADSVPQGVFKSSEFVGDARCRVKQIERTAIQGAPGDFCIRAPDAPSQCAVAVIDANDAFIPFPARLGIDYLFCTRVRPDFGAIHLQRHLFNLRDSDISRIIFCTHTHSWTPLRITPSPIEFPSE